MRGWRRRWRGDQREGRSTWYRSWRNACTAGEDIYDTVGGPVEIAIIGGKLLKEYLFLFALKCVTHMNHDYSSDPHVTCESVLSYLFCIY